MLTLSPAPVKDARPSYRPYSATVSRITRLAPHFVRVTFSGEDFSVFGTDGLDQRIKIVFPIPGRGMSDLGADDAEAILAGDWYAKWRALPDALRNPFRTYTIRLARPAEYEIDVDMVSHADSVHGQTGPASRWLSTVVPGDEVVIIGPDSQSIHSAVGIDWHPGDADRLLLAGDETAAPAICSILESLPAGSVAHAFIELPDAADRLPLNLPRGCVVTWLARGDAPVGSTLDPAVRRWVAKNDAIVRSALSSSVQRLEDVDVDVDLLWDSPEPPHGSSEYGGRFYAWLAGEAAAIKSLRRFLVSETGIDRKRIAFMGYWRAGKAEAQ